MSDQADDIISKMSKDELLSLIAKVESAKVGKKIPQQRVAISFHTVKVMYECSHCGARRHIEREIREGEQFVYFDSKGKTRQIIVKQDTVVESYMSHCTSCQGFVESLPHDELIERYMTLLKFTANKEFELARLYNRRRSSIVSNHEPNDAVTMLTPVMPGDRDKVDDILGRTKKKEGQEDA